MVLASHRSEERIQMKLELKHVPSGRAAVAAVAVTTVVALFFALAGAPGARADSGTTVTVLTQNLYFGADLTPVLQTTSPAAFFGAVATAYNQGVASDWNG